MESISEQDGDSDAKFRQLVDRVVSFGLPHDFHSNHPSDKVRLRGLVKWGLELFRHEMLRTRYFAKLSLDILCNIQVVT